MIDSTHEATALASMQSVALTGNFEETVQALETCVDHLEQGRLSLADAVAWYETGLRLTARCSELLDQAELRIRTLDGITDDIGSSHLEWDDDEI